MATIGELIAPYRSVSIIGMCKNAGKTTVLNHMIRSLSDSGETLALTSIGRDGEDKDLVTGTKKPGIYVAEGTLVATAAELVVRHCDITREILDDTSFSTPMGNVVTLRARSDGSIQLAGPSLTTQLARLREDFFRFGADKVIIDGALSRKTLCSRAVTEATVLCTGASYSKNLETVVEDTAYHCDILTLPETQDALLRDAVAALADPRATLLVGDEGAFLLPDGMAVTDALRQKKAGQTRAVFFGGAISDFQIKPLIMSNESLKDIAFVARDASKILLKRDNFDKLGRRGAALQVLENVNLAAVTVNPFSAYGFHFHKDELLEKMRERVSLPVINVMEDAL